MQRPNRTTRGLLLAFLTAILMVPSGLALADEATATTDPADAAAGWLADALEDGAVATEFGPSIGPSIDALFALAAVGVAAEVQAEIVTTLQANVGPYTRGEGFDAPDAAYAGATAKLALGLLVAGQDPTDAAGTDLFVQLLDLEIVDPAEGIVGRFSDVGDFGDFSTPLTQSLALLALQRADGVSPSPAHIDALTGAACPDGGFPSSFEAAADPATCAASVDTTGLAVQALLAVGADDEAAAALTWLRSAQADDGSFASGDGINTNSTGLAAAAFRLGGDDASAQAASDWILGVQEGCDTARPGAIPFNAEEDGLVELATAQAILGLVGADLITVSSEGSSAVIPTLDCTVDDDADEVLDDGEVLDDADEADIPQPTGVDSGISPSSSVHPLTVPILLGALLVLGGLVGVRRSAATR